MPQLVTLQMPGDVPIVHTAIVNEVRVPAGSAASDVVTDSSIQAAQLTPAELETGKLQLQASAAAVAELLPQLSLSHCVLPPILAMLSRPCSEADSSGGQLQLAEPSAVLITESGQASALLARSPWEAVQLPMLGSTL